ncbi:MAG: type III pantothenate kinase [Fimbriimonadaceae bacterium]|nr:type III pantothenate kinase [Fimbriimonadaceae bacterium]
MLLAIDVGNTHTVFGVWNGSAWSHTWRRTTSVETTEDELGAWLFAMFQLANLPFQIEGAISGSVVPGVNESLARLCERHLGTPLTFLRTGAEVGLPVTYDPPHAVGADRIANAVGALARFAPPIIVVDFGTATTFDTIDGTGTYVGGSILPGLQVSAQALFGRTAKLPMVEFRAPETAIGRNTVAALQSGIMLGYAGAVDRLAHEIQGELGGSATIVSTGGLGHIFVELCPLIRHHLPDLTLEGLRIAYGRLNA